MTFIYNNINSLNFNLDKIFSICKILDLGFKFVPNYIYNGIDFFRFLLSDLDNSFVDFNKKLFLKSKNSINNSKSSKNMIINDNDDSFSFSEKIDFKILFDSLKTQNNFQNINLNFLFSSTLETRYDLFKLISTTRHSFNKNISKEQQSILKDFMKEKPFEILQCDKNVGFLLISNADFIYLAETHLLSSNSTYIKLNEDPLNQTVLNINNVISNLLKEKHICLKFHNYLMISANDDVKLGNFRVLPKLHKNKFGIRPIINCINHPTSKICLFIDFLLKPFIIKIDNILKDSQNLIQMCNKTFSHSNMYLYSCDFESLYTNIKPIHAVNLLTDFISKFLDSDYLTPVGFKSLLELIFNNNTFSFNNMYFQQLIGIPMGCKCGPSIANLFLHLIEKSWINLNSPSIYARFIDDIFYASHTPLNVTEFQNHFSYLKLNIIEGESVNFLDLIISFNSLTRKFEFSLYVKPTNTFSYLLPNSNHPSYIFKNIPKSLFLRIRRICTSYIDYLSHSRNLFVQLLKRNYNPKEIAKISHLVSKIDRESLIPYKSKTLNFSENKLFFFSNFDNSLPNLRNLIYTSFYNTFKSELSIKPISYIQNNLGSILIHKKSQKNYSKNNFYTKPCNLDNCNTCKYVNANKFFKFNNFIIPLLCESSCLSENIVYIINCSKCMSLYIGESKKSVKERISQHLYSIKYFNKNIDKSLSNFDNCAPVAEHFARRDHSLSYFSFAVFQKGLVDIDIRRSVECDLINLCLNLKQTIMNKHIPNINNIKALSFVNSA